MLEISIAAMGLASFNTYSVMQQDLNIASLKSKLDLLMDITHLHKAHLHHLKDKTGVTNKLLGNLLETNIWFSSKITDAIEKQISVSHASSWKHCKISTTPPFGTWSTFLWHSSWNFEPHLGHHTKKKLVALCELSIQSFSNWGLASLQSGHQVKLQLAQPLQILTNTKTFQWLLCQCLHHTWHWPNNSVGHLRFKKFQTISSSDLHSFFHLGTPSFAREGR